MQHVQTMTSVLILDHDPQVAQCLVGILAQRGIRAQVADQVSKALNFVDRHHCDLAFVGLGSILNTGGIDHDILRMFRVNQPELPLVLMAIACFPTTGTWERVLRSHREAAT